MERFGFDDIQADAIVKMRLGQLTGLERIKIEDELKAIQAKIAEYQDILASESRVLEIVKDEAMALRGKFADDRLTEIVNVSGEVDVEDLIPEEECMYTLTTFGYIKRMATAEYSIQRRGGKGIKGMSRREEDVTQTMFSCSSHDFIMFFTTFGRTYRLKGYEIPEASRQSKGINIVNLLPLENGEKVSAMIRVPNFGDDKYYLCMATRKGVIKRTKLDEYRNIRKGGIIAINLDEGDELAWVKLTEGNDDIYVATRDGFGIRFNETDARAIGRTARGVCAIELRNGDEVVGMCAIPADEPEDARVLTVSETGLGRRSALDEYRCQTRGGKGSTNYKTEKYGKVASVCLVYNDDDVILISSDGIVIRMNANEINVNSRTSRGVGVMRVTSGEKVVSAAAIKGDSDDEEKPQSDDAGSESSDPQEEE